MSHFFLSPPGLLLGLLNSLYPQSLKKHWDDSIAVTDLVPSISCTMLIGVMLSTSLLDLSTLFGGGWEGYELKKGSSYMHIIVSETLSEIIASNEEKKVQN